jgi:anti-sigma regulatory factor (Ser/Thr protein kinase)
MTYVSCPNCGVTQSPAGSTVPPTTCPDCCAKLVPDYALSIPPPHRNEDPAPSFDAVLAIGRDTPREARHAFEAFAAPFGEDVICTGALLISEIVTNAVVHGPLGPAATVVLHFETLGDVLQAEVSDDGAGFVPHGRHGGQDNGSGWGLHIVEQLASAWGVDGDSSTRVWFELSLS